MMGKRSEISEVRIAVSKKSDFVFVKTWSIRDAEWGVQRVGFIINCKNPKGGMSAGTICTQYAGWYECTQMLT